MKRRAFLRLVGALGASAAIPRALAGDLSITSRAIGTQSSPLSREAQAVLLDQVHYVRPTLLPKVINVYLYGGASELAGNLTNIGEINALSPIKYPNELQPSLTGGVYTRNGFWGNAGGSLMEAMLAAGDLSLYRTVHRVVDDNRAHGRSITQNLAGSADVSQPGMAHTLAAVLSAHDAFGARGPDSLFLPFVSFEGPARPYYEGDDRIAIPAGLRYVALDAALADNPFQRRANPVLALHGADDASLDVLAAKVSGAYGERYTEMNRSLANRARLEQFVQDQFNDKTIDAALPAGVVYPATRTGKALKAAVSLAILNTDTLFISVNGAVPNWDDHNIALTNYPDRMQDLMSALYAASAHLKARGRRDVVINVYGDFGRNTALNETLGWDHGNNQNFYTLGGSAIPGRHLGRLVGETTVVQQGATRLFTKPTDGSYQCEPFAIAASMYRYFGVQNPEVLTGGVAAIDEVTPPNLRR
jgi:hypothetical protein